MRKKPLLILLAAMLTTSAQANEKQIYWGDTHLHTNRSFDAFTNRNFSVAHAWAHTSADKMPAAMRIFIFATLIETLALPSDLSTLAFAY